MPEACCIAQKDVEEKAKEYVRSLLIVTTVINVRGAVRAVEAGDVDEELDLDREFSFEVPGQRFQKLTTVLGVEVRVESKNLALTQVRDQRAYFCGMIADKEREGKALEKIGIIESLQANAASIGAVEKPRKNRADNKDEPKILLIQPNPIQASRTPCQRQGRPLCCRIIELYQQQTAPNFGVVPSTCLAYPCLGLHDTIIQKTETIKVALNFSKNVGPGTNH